MVLEPSELLERAARCEHENGVVLDMKSEAVAELDELLRCIYVELKPQQADRDKRTRMVEFTEEIVQKLFGQRSFPPNVQPFGSFIMDMFTATSDLDLSVNFSGGNQSSLSRYEKIGILRKLSNYLMSYRRQGRLCNVTPILHARVPIVKFMDISEVECDVSVENKDGVLKSYIIFLLSSIDERCRTLCCLMKAWAKAQDINSSKDNTLSSVAVILLVIFHLQTRDPPIFPPLSTVLEDGVDVGKLHASVNRFKNFGSKNTETIAELFVSLLNKLFSVKTLWEQGLCASTHEGRWISKEWESGVACISVEDFVDRTQNCARAVKVKQFDKIYDCIRRALSQLTYFLQGVANAPRLKKLLFGPMGLHTGEEGTRHVSKRQKKKVKKPLASNLNKKHDMGKDENTSQQQLASDDAMGNPTTVVAAGAKRHLPLGPEPPAKEKLAAPQHHQIGSTTASSNPTTVVAAGAKRHLPLGPEPPAKEKLAAPQHHQIGSTTASSNPTTVVAAGAKRHLPLGPGPPAKKKSAARQDHQIGSTTASSNPTTVAAAGAKRHLPLGPGPPGKKKSAAQQHHQPMNPRMPVHAIHQMASYLNCPIWMSSNQTFWPIAPSYPLPIHGMSIPFRPDYGWHHGSVPQPSAPLALQESVIPIQAGFHNPSLHRATYESINPVQSGIHNASLHRAVHQSSNNQVHTGSLFDIQISGFHNSSGPQASNQSVNPSLHGLHNQSEPAEFQRHYNHHPSGTSASYLLPNANKQWGYSRERSEANQQWRHASSYYNP